MFRSMVSLDPADLPATGADVHQRFREAEDAPHPAVTPATLALRHHRSRRLPLDDSQRVWRMGSVPAWWQWAPAALLAIWVLVGVARAG